MEFDEWPNQGVADYGVESIQALEGIEHVRKRPGMYVGGTDIRALHHIVYEVVDNSIDEALAGACDTINITLHEDGSVSVEDNGRGIPVGPHPTKKDARGKPMETLDVVMTVIGAGGKFGGGGYKVSGGLHGVGVSAVNALSEWMEVEVKRDGKKYAQRYERGVPVGTIRTVGKVGPDEHGTKQTFKFDRQIFKEADLDYRFETLVGRFREMAFVTRGVTINFCDERDGREMNFYFEGGITSFVRYLNRNRQTLHPVVHVEREVDGGRHRGGRPVHRRLHRVGLFVRQHHQHRRRRHAPDRPALGAHARHQRLCAQEPACSRTPTRTSRATTRARA